MEGRKALFFVFSQELFKRNLTLLRSANPKLRDGDDYNVVNALAKRDQSAKIDDWQLWRDGEVAYKRILQLPCFLSRNLDSAKQWQSILDSYHLSADSISSYIDLHDDVHLRQFSLDIRHTLESLGVDPSDRETILMPGIPTLLAMGTGSGETLAKLLMAANPFHLIVAVTHWDDFLSSCWHIDWSAIWNSVNSDPRKKIDLVRVHSDDDLLGIVQKAGLLAMEHAYVYQAVSADETLKKYAHILSGQRIENSVHYLGYTVDEYNMIYNSAETLKKGPRILSPSPRPTRAKFIVCGSGPSLDQELDRISELAADHIIVAGGSNYRTLRKAGIEPDYLTLVERGHAVFTDYEPVIAELGKSKTRLVMSTTCPYQLIELFAETAAYFRPALTPLSLFSDYPSEVLNFEGPESINTALAFALVSGAASVAFFGVDLGTTNPDIDRSAGATGQSSRDWNLQAPGNFADLVYTNRNQLDAKLMMEIAIKAYHQTTSFYNCSNGLFVEGAVPTKPQDYQREHALSLNTIAKQNLDLWWLQLPVYTSERMQASWRARRPRESTFRLSRQLQALFDGQTPWFPDVIHRLDELLILDVSLRDQFPRRIMRSIIYKSALAATQQFYVMLKQPQEVQSAFGAQARRALSDLVQRVEQEIYFLCDSVEA